MNSSSPQNTKKDCYFYYYSTCKKGDVCEFRHEPAAVGNEIVCIYWQKGNCLKSHCNFRHLEIKKNRKSIPCYWQALPEGCKKPHCPFLHTNAISDNCENSQNLADGIPKTANAFEDRKNLTANNPNQNIPEFSTKKINFNDEGKNNADDKKASEAHSRSLAELFNSKAKDLYFDQRYESALTLYTRALELCPKNPKYYYNRAACYMMISRYKEALAEAKKSIELDPKFDAAYSRLLKCTVMLGNVFEAEIVIQKLDNDTRLKHILIPELRIVSKLKQLTQKSTIAYKSKDFDKAISHVNSLIEISPFSLDFKITKVMCLIHLRKYEDTQAILNEVFRMDPKNPDALFAKGLIHYYEDDIGNAIQYFQNALRLMPDNLEAKKMFKKAKELKTKKDKGDEFFSAGKYHDAYVFYNEALEIDSNNYKTNARFHFKKASISSKLKDLRQELLNCNRAISCDKNYLEAILKRGHCFMKLQSYEEALKDFQTAFKLDGSKDNEKLLIQARKEVKCKELRRKSNEGISLFKAGHYQEACKVYSEALKIDPNNNVANAILHFNKAEASWRLGNLEDCISDYSMAMELNVNYVKPILKRAHCYMKLEEFEEAAKDYEKAFMIDGSKETKKLLSQAKSELKKPKDLYKILGIQKNATSEDIRKAYKKKAFEHHPDRHSGAKKYLKQWQERKFKAVGEAYRILADALKRRDYDRVHYTK